MSKEALKEIYQVLLTEPHTPTVCTKLERIAREALAQPKQEPVAWLNKEKNTIIWDKIYPDMQPLYTTPPQRTWVGLTESDRRLINYQWQDGNGTATEIIDLVEAKLKEKNSL